MPYKYVTSSISPMSSFLGDTWPPFEGDTAYNEIEKLKLMVSLEL